MNAKTKEISEMVRALREEKKLAKESRPKCNHGKTQDSLRLSVKYASRRTARRIGKQVLQENSEMSSGGGGPHGWTKATSVVTTDKQIIVTAENGAVVTLDKETGKVLSIVPPAK